MEDFNAAVDEVSSKLDLNPLKAKQLETISNF